MVRQFYFINDLTPSTLRAKCQKVTFRKYKYVRPYVRSYGTSKRFFFFFFINLYYILSLLNTHTPRKHPHTPN